MKTSKWLCVILITVLVTGGPLAPLTALAQAPQPAPAQAPPAGEPSDGAKVGAGVLNIVYVPGKVILCGTGTLVSAGLMLLTFGSAYRAAVTVFNEGCGGSWALTPYDVTGKRPPEERSY